MRFRIFLKCDMKKEKIQNEIDFEISMVYSIIDIVYDIMPFSGYGVSIYYGIT